jgi:sugar phosphate isomerase/epimerase
MSRDGSQSGGTIMKLGAYTACLHDRPIPEALKVLGELGLDSAEINAGGFVPAPHLPIEELLSGKIAREEYLDQFDQAGITLTALNVNGNPLNPDPEVGPKHAEDLRRAITMSTASLTTVLGVSRPTGTRLASAAGTPSDRTDRAE